MVIMTFRFWMAVFAYTVGELVAWLLPELHTNTTRFRSA